MLLQKSRRKLVSIGVPVYNERARIEDCIKNVQSQTYANIEICISDNCSTDGTYDIARRLADESKNIRLVRQARHIEILENFGAVRRMASGEYFMWLGADDRIYPTYIEKMVDVLERNQHAVVAQSGVLRTDNGGNIIQKVRYSEAFDQNRDGPFVQARRILALSKSMKQKKLNLYVYGVYRKAVIDEIVGERALSWGDRILPVLAALSGGLRYVDEFLFVKHVNLAKRSSDTPILQERVRHRHVQNIIWWIMSCSTIPIWRRWYGIIIAGPFVGEVVMIGVRRVVPKAVRKWLGISRIKKRPIKF